MTLIHRALGAVVAVAALLAMAWASSAPMTAHRSPDAMLRLAWSARPERIEQCRRLTDEELAALPRHMRQEVVCEGTTAEYRLQVRVDGALIADQVVRGGGLRRDRRVYVLRELAVAPGERAIDVRFERIQPEAAADAGESNPATGAATAAPGLRDSVPSRLSLERSLRLSSREVTLVTFDGHLRELVVVQPRAAARH
jgi:hypothetical protein